jgi:hypothetical protein
VNVVATSFGSAGDFLPTLAIAAALHRRGHRVSFVANPADAERVGRAGLEPVLAGAHCDIYELIERTPAYGDPANAGMLLHDVVEPFAEAVHPIVGGLLRAERVDAVVTADLNFGALWAAAETKVPSVLVTASPAMWMSWRSPTLFGDSALATLLARPLTVAAPPFLRWYIKRFLRPLARRLGTPLPARAITDPESTLALRLGLWSPSLRGPIAGDPPGTICGYARASALGGTAAGLAPEVSAFLDGGAPPVVVGLGSVYARIAGEILTNVAEACAEDGCRCLVLGHPAGARFPSNTLAVPYAPHDRVFPRAAAVVVHGGSGTTGEALRCGRPILGVALGYDQYTLCARIEDLGVGMRLRTGRRTRRDFQQALARVLSDEAMQRRAADTASRFAAERDGAEVAADAIERLVA